MLVGDLTSTIQAYFNTGTKNSNYKLSDRLIYQEALTIRSALLYAKIYQLNGFNISDNNFTVINCIELIDVDAANCPCVPVKGCTVKRSKYQLPTFLATSYGEFIDYVRTVDGKIKFNESSLAEQEDKEFREYGKTANEYFIENKYLWIYTTKKFDNLKRIRLKAIFENPLDVNEFMKLNDCEETPNDVKCTAFETEFNIDKELTRTLIDTLIRNVYNYFLIKRLDDTNNSKDDQTDQNRSKNKQQDKGESS
ncbi:MAG TPA: hypothetical protein PKD00_02500 [Burkholderiales bacterium]|nr:hypothetical protein [Burkholderiales bacterium]